MTDHVEVRSGVYYDSVSLMQVSRQVRDAAGISDAMIGMGTELNLTLIDAAGFGLPGTISPNDLVIAVRGTDDAAIEGGRAALTAALEALTAAARASAGIGGDALPPRTFGQAHTANLALISVPGRHAFTESMDAVLAGKSVMLFSDNVPLEQEIALKDAAAGQDVLVMGPDCGTAVVGGVALGFANRVREGGVGLVAASGTGAQQVMCLLDAAGVGMSHCLGVGGRDLSAAVAARSTRAALAALDADPATTSIIIVSKPGDPQVLESLTGFVAGLSTPVAWATLGAGRPDLTAAVEAALTASGHQAPALWPTWGASTTGRSADGSTGRLRGLFCGGTLADEAMLVAGETLGPIHSNIPFTPDQALGRDLAAQGHTVIDFGDDGMTQGRAHPMIDPSLRLERIAAESRDPDCAVLLVDLVLGYGSHPDPAPDLAEALRAARAVAAADGRELPVVVSLTGVEADPQGLTRSAHLLVGAGAEVYLSNAAATRRAVDLLPQA